MATEEELNDCLAAAHTGGGAKLISEQTLLELYYFAAARGLMLVGVEPYEIRGEREIAYAHLTFTPSEIYESYADLSWADCIVAVKRDIDEMLKETHRNGGVFRFTAWVSAEQDRM